MTTGRIARRALAAEVLAAAFEHIASRNPNFVGGRSVHGQFGSVDQWRNDSGIHSMLAGYLVDNQTGTRDAVRSLLRETRRIQVVLATPRTWRCAWADRLGG
jgi:hypothetical protein